MKIFGLLAALLAGAACPAQINFFGFPGGIRAPYWADKPLEGGDAEAEYAVIFVHGLSPRPRDQSKTLKTLLKRDPRAAKVVYALPAFFSPNNRPKWLPDDAALWDIRAHDWRRGDLSFGEAGVSSFAVIDRMYELFSDRARYPKLKHILLCGFSAGGQVVNRYVAVGRFARRAEMDCSFAVGAPSTYLYLDGRRPEATGAFRVPEPEVPGWDSWHFGLRGRNAYSKDLSPAEIMANLTSRPTLYLCGEEDTGARGLAASPAAMTQGENRLRRFMNYRRYIALFPEWEKKCRFVSVPGAGHQWSLVCRAPEFVRLVFGGRE
jgi:hypothetical protein